MRQYPDRTFSVAVRGALMEQVARREKRWDRDRARRAARPILLVTGTAAVAALVVTGWRASEPSATTDSAYAVKALQFEREAELNAFLPKSVTASMPSTAYQRADGVTLRASRAVVEARVVSWARGQAITTSSDSTNADGKTVPWGSKADARWIVLTLNVESVIDRVPGKSDVRQGSNVSVQIRVDGADDPSRVAQGFESLGDIVAFLTPAPIEHLAPNYDSRRPIYEVAESGALLGDVGPGESVRMLALDQAKADGLFYTIRDDVHSLSDLRAAAAHPAVVRVG